MCQYWLVGRPTLYIAGISISNVVESTCIQKARVRFWPTKRTLILFGILSLSPILGLSGAYYYIMLHYIPMAITAPDETIVRMFLPHSILMTPYTFISLFIGYSLGSGSAEILSLFNGLGIAAEFVSIYILSNVLVRLWNRKKQK